MEGVAFSQRNFCISVDGDLILSYFRKMADKKDLWVAWTRDAMGRYDMPNMDADELAEDMSGCAIRYADAMLEAFEGRFKGGGTRRARNDDDDDDD